MSYTRSTAFGENIGCAALWFLTVAVPELWAPVAPLACSSAFPKPSGRYSVLPQSLAGCLGEWNDRGSEESPQGWLMTSQPSRTSLGDPNLPSPTAFMGFLCFFASSARKYQAGTLCLLAGHGGGGVSGVEELYCHTQHEPGVAGTLHYYEGDCSEAQMAQRDCEYYSTEGNTSPNTPKHENNSTYYCDSNTASTLRHFGSERSDLT